MSNVFKNNLPIPHPLSHNCFPFSFSPNSNLTRDASLNKWIGLWNDDHEIVGTQCIMDGECYQFEGGVFVGSFRRCFWGGDHIPFA